MVGWWHFQVEFYFSDSNLPGDPFLLKAFQDSEDGSILSVVVKFVALCGVSFVCFLWGSLFPCFAVCWVMEVFGGNVACCCPGFEGFCCVNIASVVLRWQFGVLVMGNFLCGPSLQCWPRYQGLLWKSQHLLFAGKFGAWAMLMCLEMFVAKI